VSFQKNQFVHFLKMPTALYGTVAGIIDNGTGQDPGVLVDPSRVRCYASDLESAEPRESTTETFSRVLKGPLTAVPERWAADPDNKELRAQMIELLTQLNLLKPRI